MTLNAKSSVKRNPRALRTSRRSRGRSARGGFVTQLTTARSQHLRTIPTYELLQDEQFQLIETQADWIASEIGFEFRGDAEALRLFREAGAKVAGDRVTFEPGHLVELCSTAPASYKMHGRHDRHTVLLGGDCVVLMPGCGSPFVTDLENGRRYASLHDFENFVKLAYMSPWLHHSGGTVCEPVDVPVNKRHLDMVYAHLRYSTKPFMGAVTSPERAVDSIAMAKLVFG